MFSYILSCYLVSKFLTNSVFGRTPRDIREWTKPPDFQYAIYYSNLVRLMFMHHRPD